MLLEIVLLGGAGVIMYLAGRSVIKGSKKMLEGYEHKKESE